MVPPPKRFSGYANTLAGPEHWLLGASGVVEHSSRTDRAAVDERKGDNSKAMGGQAALGGDQQSMR